MPPTKIPSPSSKHSSPRQTQPLTTPPSLKSSKTAPILATNQPNYILQQTGANAVQGSGSPRPRLQVSISQSRINLPSSEQLSTKHQLQQKPQAVSRSLSPSPARKALSLSSPHLSLSTPKDKWDSSSNHSRSQSKSPGRSKSPLGGRTPSSPHLVGGRSPSPKSPRSPSPKSNYSNNKKSREPWQSPERPFTVALRIQRAVSSMEEAKQKLGRLESLYTELGSYLKSSSTSISAPTEARSRQRSTSPSTRRRVTEKDDVAGAEEKWRQSLSKIPENAIKPIVTAIDSLIDEELDRRQTVGDQIEAIKIVDDRRASLKSLRATLRTLKKEMKDFEGGLLQVRSEDEEKQEQTRNRKNADLDGEETNDDWEEEDLSLRAVVEYRAKIERLRKEKVPSRLLSRHSTSSASRSSLSGCGIYYQGHNGLSGFQNHLMKGAVGVLNALHVHVHEP
ncbi:hypothetical protein HK102_001973 [Quaeritorhiza haematococci]|nr:hypothetical protein HK102_001973 [Quaeritorhiza haematococci]